MTIGTGLVLLITVVVIVLLLSLVTRLLNWSSTCAVTAGLIVSPAVV